MFIKKLNIHNFRCIEGLSLDISKKINIFHGENGAGKTSILEAIYFLSAGKSFRKSNYKNLIRFDSDQLAVYIENSNKNKFSVQRERNGSWKGKINNTNILKNSKIAEQLKVISIDPEVYRLIDFGPSARRSFLDWCVFHVKHDYLKLWKNTHRVIKHINKLYKAKTISEELESFESQFVTHAEKLNQLREDNFFILKPLVLDLIEEILPELEGLSINYKKGWGDNSLFDIVNKERQNALKYGQLQSGPQKMDIEIKLNGVPASQSLSRGQKKTLSILFYLAYYQLLSKNEIYQPILCLDDLDAELDSSRMAFLANFIQKTSSQTFITSLQKNKLKKLFPDAEMFHVKQGQILGLE